MKSDYGELHPLLGDQLQSERVTQQINVDAEWEASDRTGHNIHSKNIVNASTAIDL